MAKFPEGPRSELVPDGSPVPNPRKKFTSEHSVSRSEKLDGHNDNPERMPHPYRDGFQPNEESGEGQEH